MEWRQHRRNGRHRKRWNRDRRLQRQRCWNIPIENAVHYGKQYHQNLRQEVIFPWWRSTFLSVLQYQSCGIVTLKGCGVSVITITAAETKDYKTVSKKVTLTVKPKEMVLVFIKSKKKKAARSTMSVSAHRHKTAKRKFGEIGV